MSESDLKATNVRSAGRVTWWFCPPNGVEVSFDATLLEEMPRDALGERYFKMALTGLEAIVEHLRTKRAECEENSMNDRDKSAAAAKAIKGKTIKHAKLSGTDWLMVYFDDGTQLNVDVVRGPGHSPQLRAWTMS